MLTQVVSTQWASGSYNSSVRPGVDKRLKPATAIRVQSCLNKTFDLCSGALQYAVKGHAAVYRAICCCMPGGFSWLHMRNVFACVCVWGEGSVGVFVPQLLACDHGLVVSFVLLCVERVIFVMFCQMCK